MHSDAIQKLVVVTNDHVFVDDAEGTDEIVVTNLCLRGNHG